MEKIRGTSGWWVIPGVGHGGLVQHTAEWELVLEAVLRGVRTIGCLGWEEGLLRFRRVQLATFRVAESDASYPELLGFSVGAELTCYLKRGQPNSYSQLFRTVVRTVRRVVDPHKAVWCEVVTQYGAYAREVRLPLELPTE